MTKAELFQNIIKKRSFLCVGLDSDIKKLPVHLYKEPDPVFSFNKQIVDAVAKYTVAFKPNIAFYESEGVKGWESLEKIVDYIKCNCPDIFLIADAKRGDIGNTSKLYARAFFETMNFDAITVSPYMGEDSITPFLEFPGKWVIILALTSNKGAFDFQFIKSENNETELYKQIIKTSAPWGSDQNIMYVVGATKAAQLQQIREIIPNHFLLVPGIGAQGGSLEDTVKYGMTKECGLLVNSSRAIIFADNTENFSSIAAQQAKEIQKEMEKYLMG